MKVGADRQADVVRILTSIPVVLTATAERSGIRPEPMTRLSP